MSRILYTVIFIAISGCAQFYGMESESQKGFIPEMLILGSSLSPEEQMIQDQAMYYTSSTRAIHYGIQADSLKTGALKKSLERKQLKAEEVAIGAEENLSSLTR